MLQLMSERDLLLIALAYQNNFVTQDRLAQVTTARRQDRTRPLVQVLVEQGGLRETDVLLLEALVENHLARHGQAARCLATLHLPESVRQWLAQVNAALAEGDLCRTLNTLSHRDPATDIPGESLPVANQGTLDLPPSNDSWATRLPPGTTDAATAPVETRPSRYRPVRSHARGGLGEVFVALDEELNREVALKEIQDRHADDPDSRARFLREAEVTGQLEHPGIVPVYGLGVYPDGRPYYAMRFIHGDSLHHAIQRFHADEALKADPGKRALELRQLLRRFQDVCNAIEYAHSRGVLHRDLKPDNVMLGAYGETLVVDWGLARTNRDGPETQGGPLALRLSEAEEASGTRAGDVLGTPAYMSPEQAEGRLEELSPASDVYSLGATLYHLLAGRPPFGGPDVGTVLGQVQRGEFLPPRRVQPNVPAALEAVCLKAMSLRPDQRYASPRDVARDVEHWLADEPVAAYPESRSQRLARWARRHRTWVRAAAVALLLVAVVSVVAALLVDGERQKAVEARAEEEEARRQEEVARRKAEEQETLALKNEAEAVRLRKVADGRLDRLRRGLYAAQLVRVASVWERDPANGLALLGDTRACPLDLRDFSWGCFTRLCRRDRLTLRMTSGVRLAMALAPDGRTLAAAHGGGSSEQGKLLPAEVQLWDVETGAMWATLKGHTGAVSALAFSPDGKSLASGGADRSVKLWSLASGQEKATLRGHVEAVSWLAFAPDGKTLTSSSLDRTVRLWDAHAGRERGVLKGHAFPVQAVAFSPDGKTLASGGSDLPIRGSPGEVKLWDVVGGKERADLKGHTHGVYALAFAPDGKTLVSGGNDETLRVWDATTGQPLGTIGGGHGSLSCLGFSSDGRTLASGNNAGVVKLWDVPTGQERKLAELEQGATAVAFTPDGATLVTGSGGGTGLGGGPLAAEVRLWQTTPVQEEAVLATLPAPVDDLAFTPDGRKLALLRREHFDAQMRAVPAVVQVWDVATGTELYTLSGHERLVTCMAFSPDGRTLATAAGAGGILNGKMLVGEVKLWDAATGRERAVVGPHAQGISSLAFSPDGKLLAVGSQGFGPPVGFERSARKLPGEVGLWEVASGKQLATLRGHSAPVKRVAFSPEGKLLAASGEDGTVRLWDAATGKELAVLKGHTGKVAGIAFSLRDRELASAGDDGTIKLWDVTTGRERASLRGHTGAVSTVTYTPDGKGLASAGQDGTIKLWDVVLGRELISLQGHKGEVPCLAFAPGGKTLASGGWDRTVRLWGATTPEERAALAGHTGEVSSVAFAGNGGALASGSADKTIRLWDAATGEERATLKGHDRPVKAVAFSPDGKILASGGGELVFDEKTRRQIPGELKLWDTATGEERASLKGHTGWVGSVAFAPDGKTLAAGTGESAYGLLGEPLPGEVRVWDVASGKLKLTLTGHAKPVGAVAFAPDGRVLASGSWDRTVRLWDVDAGRERTALGGHRGTVTCLMFAPDGRTLASGSDSTFVPNGPPIPGEVKLWDVAAGRERITLRGPLNRVSSVSFSPDGRTLAAGGTEVEAGEGVGKIVLWDLAGGQVLHTFEVRPGTVACVAFAPDGRTLASAGDKVVRLWDTGRDTFEAVAAQQRARRERHLAWHQRATPECEKQEQWLAVQWHLDRLIDAEPASGNYHARRGEARRMLGQWDRAVSDFSRAIELKEDGAWVRTARGLAYAELGHRDKAIGDYTKAMELEPNSCWACCYRGRVYATLRQWDKASADYARAIELKSDEWSLWYESALVRLQADDAAGYRKVCASLVARLGKTDDPDIATSVAWTCAMAPDAVADRTHLVQLAEKAVAHDRNNNDYLCNLGAVLYRDGKFDAAVQRLEEARKVHAREGSGADWLFLAMAHQRLGRPDQARLCLDKAVRWIEEASSDKPRNPGITPLVWNQRVELAILRREAETLLKGGKQ